MYLRFVTPQPISGLRAYAGFFVIAYDVLRAPGTSAADVADLRARLKWFEDEVKIPPRFNRTRSRNASRYHTAGLSWFKETAELPLKNAYDLKDLLERCRVKIKILKTDRPGYIIFEDDIQIVAGPFADTPVR